MDNIIEIKRNNCWLEPQKWVQNCPSSDVNDRGYNLLHFNTKNHHYLANKSAREFVTKNLGKANCKKLKSDSEVLCHAINLAKTRNKSGYGLYLEFGFCTGRSLNFIAALAFDKNVFGFDSGKGLPKDWKPGFEIGTFRFIEGVEKMPFCPLDNTTLVLGDIENTLPVFIEKYLTTGTTIDFVHIDTDLFDSAKSIYRLIGKYIIPGKTIIVLDEGYNFYHEENLYDNAFEFHELKATEEFAQFKDYEIDYLAYNENHQQLALTFKK